MPNLTNRLGPLRPASDQPAANRAAMSAIAAFASVAAFLTLIQGAPVSVADLAADAAARALWNDSMFHGQWTGPAAILSVIMLSAAQHLPRAATGALHAIVYDTPQNFRDLGRALAAAGFTWIAGLDQACRPRNQGGDSHFAVRRALIALMTWAEAGTALFPPFLCAPAYATAPPAAPNETWVDARLRRLQNLIPWAFALPGVVVAPDPVNLALAAPPPVPPANPAPAVPPPVPPVNPAPPAAGLAPPPAVPPAAGPAPPAVAAAPAPANPVPPAAGPAPPPAAPAPQHPAAAAAPAPPLPGQVPTNYPAPMPGQEHAASTLDQKFAGGQQNRAYPTTVVSAMMKEMHRALELSVGTSEYISILKACVPMITAHVPFPTDPYNFQFAQLSAFFTHHQTTHDGNDPSPPRIAAAIARLVPSMAPLLDAIDSAVDRDAKLVAKERLYARTALGHKTEAEIQAELHHKALMAAIASNTNKRPSPDGAASPAPKKRGATFSPGIQGLVDIFRSRKPGLTTDEAKELAKKLLSGRCTGCALTRKGYGSHASCPTTDCLRDKTLCSSLQAEAKALPL